MVTLPSTEVASSYVFIRDATFPLMENIKKTYSKKNTTSNDFFFIIILRKVMENAFGILT